MAGMLSSFNAHPQQTNKKQNQAGLEDGASFPAQGVLPRVWTKPWEAADAGPGLPEETSPRMPFPSPRFRSSITGSLQLATVAVFIPGKQVSYFRELVVKTARKASKVAQG